MMIAVLLAATAPVSIEIVPQLFVGIVVTEASFEAHGKTETCSGYLLSDILRKADLPSGKDIHGDALTVGIVAEARDGYRVLFSLGEIDPLLGGSKAIVATHCGGKPLPDDVGPYRLVAPNEKRAARSVRQLVRFTIRR